MIVYQYISCGLIFRGFHALEVEFFQLNLLHLRPACHYTPVSCHGIAKASHGGFAYICSSETLTLKNVLLSLQAILVTPQISCQNTAVRCTIQGLMARE